MVHIIIIWFLIISLPCEYKISEMVRFGRDLICEHSVSEIPKPPEEKKNTIQTWNSNGTLSTEVNAILQWLTVVRFAHLGYRIRHFREFDQILCKWLVQGSKTDCGLSCFPAVRSFQHNYWPAPLKKGTMQNAKIRTNVLKHTTLFHPLLWWAIAKEEIIWPEKWEHKEDLNYMRLWKFK